jgi:dipeptidyl-peptidase-4
MAHTGTGPLAGFAKAIREANAWGGGQNLPANWAFGGADGKLLYFLKNGGLFVCNVDTGLLQVEKALERDAVRRTAPMSKEEELLRERMRSSAVGVSKFERHAASDTLLIQAEGTLFTLASNGVCTEVKSSVPGARLHTSLSSDGFMGFVRARNLFLVDVKGLELQVSDAHGTVMAGEGDFIHQEEFTTYRTYWIAPPCAGRQPQVLYLEMDESPVHTYHLPNPGFVGSVDATRYALTGTANSRLRVVLATVSAQGVVTRRVLNKALLPWVEYVPRGGWFPDGNAVWLTVQDRSQTRGALLKIDLADDAFPTILHEHKSSVWCNVSLDLLMPLHFYKDGSMLIASEEVKGFAHLYILPASGGQLRAITAGDWQVVIGRQQERQSNLTLLCFFCRSTSR